MVSLVIGFGWILGLLFLGSSVFEISRQSFLNPNPITTDPIASNIHRTAYHFQPPHNWMNDPNAPMYYKGLYHFFYQHNPDGPMWTANISWGHSVSTDLIHWTGLELALTPSGPFDISGCWSGSATILPGNQPVIVYTGLDTVSTEVQNVAYPKDLSDPFLRQWTKPDYNPIIVPFEGIDVTLFRDPSTAWQGKDGLWRLIVGTVMNGDGKAILYRSHDFAEWVRAETPLHFTNGSGMWECVDFFPLGEWRGVTKYLLKVSMFDALHDHYTLGTYDEERDVFVGDDASSNDYRMWPRIDYGSVYASKTFFDEAKQRRIWWGWSNESDSAADDLAKGWAGIQAVPRVFSLDRTDGKRLIQWPVEELESLRREQISMKNIELKTGRLVEVKGLSVSQADVEVEFELPSFVGAETFDENWIVDPPKLCREKGAYANGGVGPFGLLVLAADNLEENTAVYFRVFRAEKSYKVLMCADQRRSSKRNELYKPASGGFVDVDIQKDGKISLRTLIDHSVVESFGGGGRTCITSRVYPTLLLNGNTHVYAFNYGTETVKISELKAWNMAQAQIS